MWKIMQGKRKNHPKNMRKNYLELPQSQEYHQTGKTSKFTLYLLEYLEISCLSAGEKHCSSHT